MTYCEQCDGFCVTILAQEDKFVVPRLKCMVCDHEQPAERFDFAVKLAAVLHLLISQDLTPREMFKVLGEIRNESAALLQQAERIVHSTAPKPILESGDSKILAIKKYREITGASLLFCKERVDEVWAEYRESGFLFKGADDRERVK